MPVVIYTIPDCPKCSAAKALLKRKGITFDEADVQADAAKMQEMMKKLGAAESEVGMPVIDIAGTIIQGFDREKILAALGERGV